MDITTLAAWGEDVMSRPRGWLPRRAGGCTSLHTGRRPTRGLRATRGARSRAEPTPDPRRADA